MISPAGLVPADSAIDPDSQSVTDVRERSSLLRRLCEAPAVYLLTNKMGLLVRETGKKRFQVRKPTRLSGWLHSEVARKARSSYPSHGR